MGLCAALVVPGAAVFLQHAIGDRVQANWVAILYPGCALAACGALWWRRAAVLGAVLTGVLYVQAVLAPLPLPRGVDPGLRLAGWEGLAGRAAAAGGAFLASEEYGVASLLAWSGVGVPVMGAEARWGYFALPGAVESRAGLLLQSARRREGPDPALWASAELVGSLGRMRGAVEAEGFRLYRVVPRPGAPAVWLPQPARPGHATSDIR